MLYTVFAKCFLQYGNKVLILKKNYDGDKWHLPGGGVEANETVETACIREIAEETGISVREVKYAGSTNFFYKDKQFIGVRFSAKSPTDTVTLSEEHTDFAWITRSQINDYDLVNGSKRELLEYFASQ